MSQHSIPKEKRASLLKDPELLLEMYIRAVEVIEILELLVVHRKTTGVPNIGK